MDHIVSYIRPFVIQQQIAVYRDGQCIHQAACPLSMLEEKIIELSDKFNINEVDLAGDVVNGERIKKDINNPTKYGLKKKLHVNVRSPKEN